MEKFPAVVLEKLRGRWGGTTLAASTRNIRARHWRHFETWCKGKGLPYLPSSPEVVATYLAACADGEVRVEWKNRSGETHSSVRPKKYSTIEGIHCSIIYKQREAGYEWPRADPRITGAMQRIREQFGTKVKKTAPLDITTLKEGFKKYKRLPLVYEERDKVMLALGFFGALKRAELLGLRVEDLRFTPKGLLLTMRKGKPVPIPPMKDQTICPVRLTQKWLAALKEAGISSGPLFRRMDQNGSMSNKPLAIDFMTVLVKKFAEVAGLDPLGFGAHSLRAGFAASAAAQGKSVHAIMRQTRLTSARSVMTYTRRAASGHSDDVALFDDNAADGID